jgi:hypothetical protein
MRDMQAYLERLRLQIVECEAIRDLAIDPNKRELFTRLAEHFNALAGEIEMALIDQMPIKFLGRKTLEPFPKEKE